MKRSEMINLIVYETLSWDGLDTNGVPLKEIAEAMLELVQKHGMLPPPHSKAMLANGLKVRLNDWEPEDETK